MIPVKDLPVLSIQSSTGFGAVIKAQITPRPDYQGEIRQVIDCVSPRDGIVGFINGEPYYGPFHIHPQTGLKMVGAAHTTAPHAIIYDTPAQSRGSNVVIAGSTNIPTVSSAVSVSGPSGTPTSTTSSTPSTMGPTGSPPSSPPSTPPSSPPSTPPTTHTHTHTKKKKK